MLIAMHRYIWISRGYAIMAKNHIIQIHAGRNLVFVLCVVGETLSYNLSSHLQTHYTLENLQIYLNRRWLQDMWPLSCRYSGVSRRSIQLIEHLLRKGHKQLDHLKQSNVSSFQYICHKP
jgi:hypothetical protein